MRLLHSWLVLESLVCICSAIGATIVTAGFYAIMWGQTIEKDKLLLDLAVADELGSSDQTTPLLSSINESKC